MYLHHSVYFFLVIFNKKIFSRMSCNIILVMLYFFAELTFVHVNILWRMDMQSADWFGKGYYSLGAYFKNRYGHRLYKISVDAGLSCPNRDGTLDTRGCIFCSRGGSGEFSVSLADALDICGRKSDKRYIIYFQAFTNTYGDIDYLRYIYTRALAHPNVYGISIGTRADCLGDDVLRLLRDLHVLYSKQDKFIWIELGLQTIHEGTASYIRRGYPLSVYDRAVSSLSAINIPYVTHIILGLPDESFDMMLDTVRYVCSRPGLFGLKLQLLHVLKDTDLADDYTNHRFRTLTFSEYLNILTECLRIIPDDIVIHRVTGDGPRDMLIAPEWSLKKRNVLNSLHKLMKDKDIRQGDRI